MAGPTDSHDGGSLVGAEPDDVGVGVGSVQVGDDACVGDVSAGVGIGAVEELVGVGVGVRVGRSHRAGLLVRARVDRLP